MWDLIFQAVAAILVGAAVGYGVAAIIDALSKAFAELWKNMVAEAKALFGYISEATQHYLALIAQYLDTNWSEIEAYLRAELGYSSDWIIAVFQQGQEVFLNFANPQTYQEQSRTISWGIAEDQAQLPSEQNPIITRLKLA